MQSEKSKKAGHAPPTTLLIEFLKTSYIGCSDILLLEEDMNFNARAASLSVSIVHLKGARCFNLFFFSLDLSEKTLNWILFWSSSMKHVHI